MHKNIKNILASYAFIFDICIKILCWITLVIIKDMKVMFLRDFVYYVELFIVEKLKQNYSFIVY